MGGDLPALLDHLGGSLHDRGAAVHDRFRSAGAAAGEELVAVALEQTDALERDAEPLAQHLRERRGMALAVIEGAGDDGDGAVGLEADAAHLLRRRCRDLEKAADAEPAHAAALAALSLAAPETLGVGGLERMLEHARKIAAVVVAPRCHLARQLARPDLVAPAQFQPIDPHLDGGGVDQALHVVVAFRPAGAAIGGDVRGVGEHALGRNLDQRRAIDALHVLDGIERRRHRRDLRKKAAHVAVVGDAHRQEGAVGIERKLGGELVISPVAVGHEAARALVGPFDRTAERARRMQHADIFRKRRRLHAERAADMAGQDANLLRLDLEDLRHVAPQPEHSLRRGVQREASARRLVDADRRARLHRVDHHPAVDQLAGA